jgi:hypothetical protein
MDLGETEREKLTGFNCLKDSPVTGFYDMVMNTSVNKIGWELFHQPRDYRLLKTGTPQCS